MRSDTSLFLGFVIMGQQVGMSISRIIDDFLSITGSELSRKTLFNIANDYSRIFADIKNE